MNAEQMKGMTNRFSDQDGKQIVANITLETALNVGPVPLFNQG
jgi:hypothetical protein